MELDIHAASEEERVAAYGNVYDVWPQAASLEEHVQTRLASVQHNRAAWYVGCVEGRVVTSLACYPLQFLWHGTRVQGMAIGSVHTLAEYRGRGFARRLIRWVEECQRPAGVKLSLLYSDIDADYYAALGYVRCPSHEGWTDPRERPISSTGKHLRRANGLPYQLQPSPTWRSLAVQRSDEYCHHLAEKQPRDDLYFLDEIRDEGGDSPVAGFVRLSQGGSPERQPSAPAWRLADFCVLQDDDRRLDRLYQQVLDLAAQRGVERVGGWMPDAPASRKWFNVRPRAKEITMLKPLDDTMELTGQDLAAADWFCEIDHV